MESPTRVRRPRRALPTRISVRFLLALVAVIAVGLGIREAYSPFRVWQRAIHDPDGEARSRAMSEAFDGSNPALDRERAFAEIVSCLRDPHVGIRSSAASALNEAGALGERALPELIAATKDASPEVRMNAYGALAWNSTPNTPGRDEVIAVLTRGLADPDRNVRGFAVNGLIFCGRGEEALDVFLEPLRDEPGFVPKGFDWPDYKNHLICCEAEHALFGAGYRCTFPIPPGVPFQMSLESQIMTRRTSHKAFYLGPPGVLARGSIAEYAEVEAASLLARCNRSAITDQALPTLRMAATHGDPTLRKRALIGLEKAVPVSPTPR